jgi:translation initiation factor 1A
MYQSNIRNAKKRGAKGDREFLMPDAAQQFAMVQDMLGNGRVRALCQDGSSRVGRIRGSMRKYKNKVIIGRGDLIIVALREFDAANVDVVHKYDHDECSKLLVWKTLPESIHRALTTADQLGNASREADETEDYVFFGEVDVDAI